MKRVLIAVLVIVIITFLSRKLLFKAQVAINNQTFQVEVADTREERTKGLSGRKKLGEKEGMLFVFEETGLHTFWMKDTLIPLDIIFIKDDRIVTIHKNIQPQPNAFGAQLQLYLPKDPVNYVLEINGGLSEKYGFTQGDVITITKGNRSTITR